MSNIKLKDLIDFENTSDLTYRIYRANDLGQVLAGFVEAYEAIHMSEEVDDEDVDQDTELGKLVDDHIKTVAVRALPVYRKVLLVRMQKEIGLRINKKLTDEELYEKRVVLMRDIREKGAPTLMEFFQNLLRK
ncbi:MAG: hypothetical protein IM547_01640 [Chitinophagaceae bacterium]|nr:hypothetical protein [Chitinophagaceae bacterium]